MCHLKSERSGVKRAPEILKQHQLNRELPVYSDLAQEQICSAE